MSYKELKSKIGKNAKVHLADAPTDLILQIQHQLESKGLIPNKILKKYNIL